MSTRPCSRTGLLLLCLLACDARDAADREPSPAGAGPVTLSAGDLTATFVDNRSLPPTHRAGYNGIAALVHADESANVFVPDFSGFNFEHILSGEARRRFEPRRNPMALARLGPRSVALHQPATRLSRVESRTVFTLTPPHYIDVEFQCVIHPGDHLRHGHASLFWASYVQAPGDLRMHFWGRSTRDERPRWISAESPRHGVASTHPSHRDRRELYYEENDDFLPSKLSGYRFLAPFFYGRIREMVLVYMFDDDGNIRFSQSPTGGGAGNPAWDFQLALSPFEFGRVYGYRARLVYKPFLGEEDVRREFEGWRAGLGSTPGD